QVIGCTGRCAAGRLQRYIDGNAEWMLDAKQSGGGPMYNLGVHWIDLFNWLLGSSVKSAFGTNVKVNPVYNIEDNSYAILTYENGTVLNLDISYTVPEAYPHGRDLFIGIRGTCGVISWSPAYEGEKDELFICSDHELFQGAPVQRRSYEITPVSGYSGIMGLHYLKDVVEAVRDKKPAPISGEDGVEVLKIVEAIYKSAREKSMVYI
ncbi:MAG TPA: Gfo/Idh/MocA family oxidoreductase, partial [bacterium]